MIDAQKEKLIEALDAPGRSMEERLRSIGEDPANYPAQLLEDLDWFSNMPEERISYIMKIIHPETGILCERGTPNGNSDWCVRGEEGFFVIYRSKDYTYQYLDQNGRIRYEGDGKSGNGNLTFTTKEEAEAVIAQFQDGE